MASSEASTPNQKTSEMDSQAPTEPATGPQSEGPSMESFFPKSLPQTGLEKGFYKDGGEEASLAAVNGNDDKVIGVSSDEDDDVSDDDNVDGDDSDKEQESCSDEEKCSGHSDTLVHFFFLHPPYLLGFSMTIEPEEEDEEDSVPEYLVLVPLTYTAISLFG
ncbi:hypothetical protein CAPTEDRAFT_200802 [Capitella teleta]|uniref:Uncharacterized protein n=1 Tax=Capitella teleta TaxID=283909 RepID=R7UVY1_CAPTE|nr:hypothetical protein CAPTEDRAFT_200802 [Capitella teleta]|eukprot:ELU10489.1 hypothetical protein CAPTEDRAFT_200802 [Capitella teleta]